MICVSEVGFTKHHGGSIALNSSITTHYRVVG